MSQSSRTTQVQEIKRDIKVPFAIVPLRPRYTRQKQDIINKMKPFELDQLPPIFIPHAVPGSRRMPPVLRCGYPITTKALLNLVRDEGYEEIPAPGSPSRIVVLELAQAVLQDRLQWPVQWELVHGVSESIIFESCNNYNLREAMPGNREERMREELLAEGPPLWHLDYYKDNWDWQEHK